ncbi:MAG TPA: beta-eliminating lyase-related protein [Thermoanaerobaculia bacterium]|nr:beta-eliminating lyase-related protein [Thermoanaerobaculia bacterium]
MPDFRSDNVLGCSPEILAALARENSGTDTSYGGDAVTARLRERCCKLFETEVDIFPVVTGTAANALALSALTPRSGTVLCHEDAHILRDEDGATELLSGGARLLPMPGADGKLHELQPASSISITNATEAGTVYSVDEIRALHRDLPMHMDGARFANAVAATGASPADLTWRSGVDVLTFGATKNGALAAELIVLFRRELAEVLAALHQRSGHRVSKMRFISAQFEAYLADDLWLRNARHANAMAARLARSLADARIEIVRPVHANIVFARFPPALAASLHDSGFQFYSWSIFGPDIYRLVCGFATSAEDVDALAAACARPARPL